MSTVVINTNPKSQEELVESLGQIRANLETSAKHAEAFERAAADIAEAKQGVKAAEDAVRIAKNAEEIAKATAEASRSLPDNVAKQLRSLPRVHNVEKDTDFRGKADPHAFNLLMLTRKELRTYLSGDALDFALRYRKLNDMALTAHTIMRAGGDAEREAYMRAGGMKSLPFYDALERTVTEGKRALDIQTSGGVSEWIPTFYSADLFDAIRDQTELSGAFRWMPMPQSPWTMPTLTGHMRFKLAAESTSDTRGANTIAVSDPTSSNRTLTAKKLAALSYWSRETDQDSIVAVLPMFQNDLEYAGGYEMDNICWNGQLTSTIDTGDDPAVTDARDGFDGIRWGAKSTGKQVDFGGTLTVESLAAMIGKAGALAQLNNCFFGTGYSGMARLLVLKDSSGNVLNLTRDRAGADATLFGGTVGVLLGYPLRIGGVVPQNLDATGIISGAGGTKTAIHFVNANAYIGGTRQAMQVEVSDHSRFEEDQRAIKATMRLAFRSKVAPSASFPCVVEGVNIPAY